MGKDKSSNLTKRKELVAEFLEEIKDSNHRRILKVYLEDESVESMEAELTKILLEIISDED